MAVCLPPKCHNGGVTVQRQAAETAKKATVQLAGAGIGLAAGGPFGAIVGAASVPIIELVALRERRSYRNMEFLIEMVTELCGVSAEEFAAWAQERDERLFLATSALQAAYDTKVESKIRGLARVLAENVQDDARLDLSSLVVAALGELEAPHIRVLHTLVHEVPPATSQNIRTEDDAWHCAQLKEHLPNLADGIMPLIATLFRTGMITEGISSEKDNLSWEITRFGINCLNYLHGMDAPLQ